MSDKELFPLIEKSFLDPDFALIGGESNVECQKRAIKVLKELLNTYRGQKVVLGTHGAVMTLMMGYYDSKYDLNFYYRHQNQIYIEWNSMGKNWWKLKDCGKFHRLTLFIHSLP